MLIFSQDHSYFLPMFIDNNLINDKLKAFFLSSKEGKMGEKRRGKSYWWNIVLSSLAKIKEFELTEGLEGDKDEDADEDEGKEEKKKYTYFKKISGLSSAELTIFITSLNNESNLVETEGRIYHSVRGGGSGYYAKKEPLFRIGKFRVKIDKKNDAAPSYEFDILLMINNAWVCYKISDSLHWTGAWEYAFEKQIRDLIPEPLRDEVKQELDRAREEMKKILNTLNDG